MIRALTTEDWPYIAEHTDITFGVDTGGMILEHEGQIVAASIFDTWMYNSVFMHMLITNMRQVMRAGFVNEVFDYIFTTTGRKVALGLVPDKHKPSLRLAKRFGFVEKTRIEDGFAEGNDLVILELKRENCPYWTGVGNAESTKTA